MDAAEQLVCYSIDDIYHLPEGKRAELIDGELYMMAVPGMRHQWISPAAHSQPLLRYFCMQMIPFIWSRKLYIFR